MPNVVLPVQAATIQQIIVDEVGDDADGYLAARISPVWASYADKALIFPRLQELYSKRRLIDLLLGRKREQVDFQIQGDLALKQQQKVANLQAMRADVQAEMTKLETQSIRQRPVQVGTIQTIRPDHPPLPGVILPDDTRIDASDPRYSGDPYRKPPGSGNYGTNSSAGPIPPL